jgi:hypothetical protein
MTRQEYTSLDAENFSNIKRILKSLAAYKYGEPDKKDETAFAVGTLAHAMILENKDLRDLYVMKPEGMSFATKDGRAWKAEQTLPILTFDEWNLIPAMAEAIANDKDASAIIRICKEREQLITGEIQGTKFKGIMDLFGHDDERKPMHADLKTVVDASPRGFAKAVKDFHYDLQDEIYSQLIALKYSLNYRPPSAWICVEKTKPYEVACYFPSEKLMEIGEMKLNACIARLKRGNETGLWPKSLSGLKELTPAPYAEENARALVEY